MAQNSKDKKIRIESKVRLEVQFLYVDGENPQRSTFPPNISSQASKM
jgi:hypothetical protein